jgi:hypothetical protein
MEIFGTIGILVVNGILAILKLGSLLYSYFIVN